MVAPPAPTSSNEQTNNEDANMNADKSKGSGSGEEPNSEKVSRMNSKGHFIKHKGIR
jgi:hypothetical protein